MDGEARLTVGHVLQRHVGAAILLVVHHRMTVGEGATATVLAGDADRMALVEQRGVGQGLGEAPVDGHAAGLHLAAVLVDLGHLALHGDAVGNLAHPAGEALQTLHLDPGVGMAGPLVAQVGRPVDEQRLVGLLHQGVGHVVAGLQVVAVLLHHRLGVVIGEQALLDQALDVAGP